MRPRYAGLWILALGTLACGPTQSSSTEPMPPGRWGGPNVELVVERNSWRVTHLGACFDVRSRWPLTVDAAGQIHGLGLYRPFDVPPVAHPAQVTGTIRGDRLTLAVKFTPQWPSATPVNATRTYELVRDVDGSPGPVC